MYQIDITNPSSPVDYAQSQLQTDGQTHILHTVSSMKIDRSEIHYFNPPSVSSLPNPSFLHLSCFARSHHIPISRTLKVCAK